MKFLERFENDKKVYQNLKTKESKIHFIWDYYKLPIFCIVLILAICVYSIYAALIKKPVYLRCVFLNTDYSIVETDSTLLENIYQDAGIDTKKQVMEVDDRMHIGISVDAAEDAETLQVLNALFSMREVDIFVANKETISLFDEKDAFLNLSELIDNDLLEKNKDKLWVGKDSSGKEVINGIILSKDSILHKAGYYHDEKIIAIAANGTNIENALILLNQILNG